MITRRQATGSMLAGVALSMSSTEGGATEPVQLPAAARSGGMPLMSALAARHSTREYSDRALSPQTLGELLWAAFGINRPSGERTAPYWRHVMVIDVYLAMADGVWLYEPQTHVLRPYLPHDLRAQTGMQEFVATVPLNLVYVAHGERMQDISAEERRLYASVDAAFIGQNVYLYCASVGLGSVFRGAVDARRLGELLKLPEGQFVTFAQSIGYPRA